jgi:hypothetical protein
MNEAETRAEHIDPALAAASCASTSVTPKRTSTAATDTSG